MVRSLCARGNHETLKGGVHAAVGILAGLCAVYNFTAWCFRRDRHLGLNAAIYALAVVWELKHTLHHLEPLGTRNPEPGMPVPELQEQAA